MGLLLLIIVLLFLDVLGPLLYLLLILVVASFLLHALPGLLYSLNSFGHSGYGYGGYGNGWNNGFYLPIHLDGTTILLLIVIAVLFFRRPRRW